MSIILSEDQEKTLEDVRNFLLEDDKSEITISGSPGTGKTTLVKEIISIAKGVSSAKSTDSISFSFFDEPSMTIRLTSTTNKAAAVLSEATDMAASTVHALFNLRVVDDYETGKTRVMRTPKTEVISDTLIIIDEASMINTQLLKTIRKLTLNCKIIYVGDSFQLAPVKENVSPVFNGEVEGVQLTHIHRQPPDSSIIPFAHKFKKAQRTNKFPKIKTRGSDVILLESKEFGRTIDAHFLAQEEANDCRIVCWENKLVHRFNKHIRQLKEYDEDFFKGEFVQTNKPVVDYMGDAVVSVFHTDQVIQITAIQPDDKDGYPGWYIELENVVTVFQPENPYKISQAMKAAASKENWPKYFALKNNFADLRPAYASTVNKAQGSTYKVVFIDVANIAKCTRNSDIARMMYVAVSRASDTVYMRGQLPKRLYK